MTRSSAYRDPLVPDGSESRMELMATIKHVALRSPPCGTPAVVVSRGVSYFHLYCSFIKVVMDKFEHSTIDPHLREVIYDDSPTYCVERFLKVKKDGCGCFLVFESIEDVCC